MSQPALELVDPGSAFLASGDPARFLEDNLPSTEPAAGEDQNHVKAAVLIAGAFIVWRLWMTRRAREEIPGPPVDAEGALGRLWAKHKPIWLRIAEPTIEAVMADAGLTGEELRAVAADYAAGLGSYIHTQAADAVLAGFREQLRRGVNPTLSWLRAIEGYGLEERRLRSWVAQQAVSGGPISDLIAPGALRALDRAMLARADVLGQNEAWHARHVAKSVAWLYAQRRGELPTGTRKRWLTADDERVCKICGPLHLQEVWLDQQFILPTGQRLWAPGVHPNCRCELALVYPSLIVEKAVLGDPYDRDTRGRFATQESRRRKVTPLRSPVTEREPVDPAVAAMFAQPTEPEVPSLLDDTPSLTGANAPSLLADAPSLLPEAPALLETAPSLLGGPSMLGAEHRRPIYILVNGEPKNVTYAEGGVVRVDGGHAMFPADDYFHRRDPYHRTDEPPDQVTYRVGDEVDLRWLEHPHGKMGKPFEGHIITDDGGGLMRVLDATATSYYPTADGSDHVDNLGDFYYRQNALYQDVEVDPRGYVNMLDDREIELFMQDHMGEDYDSHWVGPNQMRADLVQAIVELGDSELAGALANYVLETGQHGDEDLDDDLELIDAEVGRDYVRVPSVFSFPWGFYGNWVPGTSTPEITGAYQVAKIVHHQLQQNDGSERFRAWTEVQLRPADQEH